MNPPKVIIMQEITIKITKYEEPVTMVVDEHPIVNDPDYVDVVTTAPTLHYIVDGAECSTYGAKDDSFEDTLQKVTQTVIFQKWLEENQYKTYDEIGVEAPLIYDPEEFTESAPSNVFDFIYNCRWLLTDKEYEELKQPLMELALQEYEVIIEDCQTSV